MGIIVKEQETREGSGHELAGMGWESSCSRVSKGVGFRKTGELGKR